MWHAGKSVLEVHPLVLLLAGVG
eukprot:SAG31_NODE_44994_length_260_cov_0.968944_1_plen_22_part_10